MSCLITPTHGSWWCVEDKVRVILGDGKNSSPLSAGECLHWHDTDQGNFPSIWTVGAATYDVGHCSQILSTDLYQRTIAAYSGQWDTKYIIFKLQLSGVFKTSGGRSLCSSLNATAVALCWCRTHAKCLKVFVELPQEGNQWSDWQIIL